MSAVDAISAGPRLPGRVVQTLVVQAAIDFLAADVRARIALERA